MLSPASARAQDVLALESDKAVVDAQKCRALVQASDRPQTDGRRQLPLITNTTTAGT